MLTKHAEDKPFLVHQLGDPMGLKRLNDVYLLRYVRAGFCVDTYRYRRYSLTKVSLSDEYPKFRAAGVCATKLSMIMTLAHLTISGSGWFLVSPARVGV